MKKKFLAAAAALSVSGLALAGCSGGGDGGDSAGTINYWLWDANQLPAYQQCADDFHAANPDLTVKITQLGWDDYWSKLTNAMAAGNAPDVFTDHLAKYPDFLKTKQLVALDDVKMGDYADGLASLPDDPRLAGAPGKAVAGPSALSATGLKLLAAIKDVNPRVYAKHTAPAA